MYQEAIKNYLAKNHYTSINLKAVLFDMDGILFNSMPNHAEAWHKTMAQFGFTLSREEAYMHEGRTGAATINIVSQRERGFDATEEEIKRIYQAKSDLFNQYPKAERMPGAWEVLTQIRHALRACLCVVFGNSYSRMIWVCDGKVSSPISVWLGTVTEVILSQPKNASYPIPVTLLGIVTEVKP